MSRYGIRSRRCSPRTAASITRSTCWRKLQGEREIRLTDGPERQSLPGGEGLVLTSAELDAVRDFINPKKMKAKHLKPSKDDGVHTVDGYVVADPGFLSALRKIAKSYERPE
jgi:hypothetical protein